VVEVAVDGDLQPLSYAQLVATDEAGEQLDVRMEWTPNAARLVVGDGAAAYPVRIDPLLSDPSWTAESDQVWALFGYAVSGAGDVNADGFDDVVVGAYGYDDGEDLEGRAYVFHGSAAGLDAAASWTAEADQVGAYLGFSVSGAGDVNADGFDDVVVGAPLYDDGESAEGRAYVFHGSAAGLEAAAAWTAESDQVHAVFGQPVSGAGDVNADGFDDVVVGAGAYDDGEENEGRAFLYEGSGDSDSDTDTDVDTDTDADTDTDTDADTDTDTDADTDADTDGDTDVDSDADSDTDTDSHRDHFESGGCCRVVGSPRAGEATLLSFAALAALIFTRRRRTRP
jgi:hypothetical protein